MASWAGFTITPLVSLGTPAYLVGEGMCLLYVRLSDMEGRPIVGQRILFYEPPNTAIEGPIVEIETGADGRAEVELLRGREVEVAFLGTSFIRRIIVPDQEAADILEVANLSVFDAFAVVKLDPIPAIRRSIP